MKHIKKKFLGKVKISQDLAENLMGMEALAEVKNLKIDEMVVWGLNEDDEFISMFTLKDGRNNYIMPEPDLVVCMFEMGRQNALRVPDLRKKLLSSLNSTHDTFIATNEFYSSTSIAAISLINAMESFINRIIPNNFKFEQATSRNTAGPSFFPISVWA